MSNAASWVIVATRPSSEYTAADSLRRAGYRVYLPQRKVHLASWRLGALTLRPLWPGYLFCHDWRGWPEQQVEGEPRLLKRSGEVVSMPRGDVALIRDRELSGAFDDPLPGSKSLKRTDIVAGDSVTFDFGGRDIPGVLDELSDDGKAILRAILFGRETVIRDVPQDSLRLAQLEA